MMHETLHAAQDHDVHDHAHEHSLYASNNHDLDDYGFEHARIVYPDHDKDFEEYSHGHQIPGHSERIVDPHDKLYDKHY